MTVEESLFIKRHQKIIRSLNLAFQTQYYKNLFTMENIKIDNIKSYEDFVRIPILDKAIYRDNMFDFVPADIYQQGFNIEEFKHNSTHLKKSNDYLKQFNMLLRTTSGSTGLPLEIIIHASDLHNAYFSLNKFRQKAYRNFFNYKFTWIWFENVRGYKKETNKYIQMNPYGFQYYVYSISDDEFKELLNFLINENISWLISTPTFLSIFSEYILKNKIDIGFSLVECQSEYLFEWQREIISRALRTNPINIYSSNEVHFIGATCANNNLHILDDNVFVELIDNNLGKKEVVVTNINCDHMPLIRYRIGDIGEWDDTICDCRYQMPILKLEEFRINDMISLKNGEKLDYWIITESIIYIKHHFKINFDQFQVVQSDYDHFEYFIRTNCEVNNSIVQKILDYLIDYYLAIFKYKVRIDLNFQKTIIHNYMVTKYKHFFNAIEHKNPYVNEFDSNVIY